MHYGDYLNRPSLPFVSDNVGVEVPEAIAEVEKFLVVVANPWRSAQMLKAMVELHTKPLGSIGRVFSDVK